MDPPLSALVVPVTSPPGDRIWVVPVASPLPDTPHLTGFT